MSIESKMKSLDQGGIYENIEVAELIEPFEIIIQKMREQIEKGEYSLIIGEDASGRIPALIFYDFLKQIYKQKNFRAPELKFLTGSRNVFNPSEKQKKLINLIHGRNLDEIKQKKSLL